MRTETVSFAFQALPPLVKRGQNALILLRDSQRRFVLGSKAIYPEGISRMLGGGIKRDEDPDQGALRELAEETGLTPTAENLVKLVTFTALINSLDQEQVTFISHIYLYDCGSQPLKATDDVDELKYLTPPELVALIARFKALPTELHPDLGFAWSDYGQINAAWHQMALDEVIKRQL